MRTGGILYQVAIYNLGYYIETKHQVGLVMGNRNFWENSDTSRLKDLLRHEKNLLKYKRIQCIYLRVSNKLKAPEIANILGWPVSSVWGFHSLYKKNGNDAFNFDAKGGRYHQNLSLDEEIELINSFAEDGTNGGILEVGKVKVAFEKKLGRKVHKTNVYRALHRNGWRKIAPRKKHPKNDKEAMETFKKTSHLWCRVQKI